jgi:molecular chaperone HscB
MDPFAILGVPPAMDLDERELERRYLQLSRQSHPDHRRWRQADAADDVLATSARLNEAFAVLRDPWRRAQALVERASPGAMERAKSLAPAFLQQALELAEEVAGCSAEQAPALRQRLTAAVAAHLQAVRNALAHDDLPRAATLLHEARYLKKALADLQAPEQIR